MGGTIGYTSVEGVKSHSKHDARAGESVPR